MVAFFVPPPLATPQITFTLVGQNNTGGSTATLPGGIASGDLGVILQYGGGDGTPSFSPISGWTSLVVGATPGVDAGAAGWCKILDGTETNIATGTTNSAQTANFAIVFRPSIPITSVNIGTWSHEETDGNPSAQTANPSALPAPSIVFGLAGALSSSFSFSTFSPSPNNTYTRDTGDLYAITGYRIYNNTPQSTLIDMNDQGTRNVLISGYIQVT